jgi:hypothetical protein
MKNIKTLIGFVALITAVIFLNSCVKDKLTTTYTLYKPVYKNKLEVIQGIKSNAPQPLLQTGKFFKYGNYIFVNEVNKGVHIIDNSNPAAPVNKYFISIPGNVDLAVKDNTLYADIYTDLITIDISNPQTVVVKKMLQYIFPERQYTNGFLVDSTQYIIDWVKYETVNEQDYVDNKNSGVQSPMFFDLSVGSSSNSSNIRSAGVGGSMARFTIIENYLYTVGRSTLSALNITNTNDPVVENTKSIGWNIETIYPFKNKLFIGGQNGMFIYDVSNPANPIFNGNFSHACFRDPVIADDKYAYVTLRAMGQQGTCWNGLAAQRNELDIVNITNLSAPALVKIYDMTEPKGLSKDGNHLFICDGKDGLKVYNAADVLNLTLIKQIKNITPFDVIVQDGIAIVVADEGIFQYDYADINNIKLLSKIVVGRN